MDELKKSPKKNRAELTQARAEDEKIRKALSVAISRRGTAHGAHDTPQGNGDDDASDEDEGEGDEDEDEDELPDAIHDVDVYCLQQMWVRGGWELPKLLDEL